MTQECRTFAVFYKVIGKREPANIAGIFYALMIPFITAVTPVWSVNAPTAYDWCRTTGKDSRFSVYNAKTFYNMASEIKLFSSPKFGDVRTIITDDRKLMFVASDVAKALGYAVPQKAVSTHCKHCSKMEHPTNKGTIINIIPESDLYRLTMKSQLPDAEKFQDWVCDEVLPSLRQTGTYSIGKPLSPIEMQLEMMKSMQLQLQELIDTKEEVRRLKSEIAEVRQRTTTEIEASTIVAYVTRNHIKLDVTKYGAMGRKATSLCKKRGIEVTKINDVRWGMVSVYPDTVLAEVFK